MKLPDYGSCIEFANSLGIGDADVVNRMRPKIRFALLTSCQSGCDFCHLEGSKNKKEIGTLNNALAGWKSKKHLPLAQRLDGAVSMDGVHSVIDFAYSIGAETIHLTGGEPTLHPRIADIVRTIRASSLNAAITSHGEIGETDMKEILDAGVNSVNFSVHALQPEEYVAMDLVAKMKSARSGTTAGLAYAESRLARKMANVDLCKKHEEQRDDFMTKINSVVLDAKQSIRIALWGNAKGIESRFQKNLNQKSSSDVILSTILRTLDAELVRVTKCDGDSTRSALGFSYPKGVFEDVAYAAGMFTVKEERLGDVYLDALCDDCELKGTDRCRERFYGVRARHENISLCMDSNDEKARIPLTDIADHAITDKVREHYDQAIIYDIFV